ncbi:hypothetical protein J6590_057106 [Homalodisca vitripennis]|nr:hypothetical protein J6590_057106 [Homalodisca vitripennis]
MNRSLKRCVLFHAPGASFAYIAPGPTHVNYVTGKACDKRGRSATSITNPYVPVLAFRLDDEMPRREVAACVWDLCVVTAGALSMEFVKERPWADIYDDREGCLRAALGRTFGLS